MYHTKSVANQSYDAASKDTLGAAQARDAKDSEETKDTVDKGGTTTNPTTEEPEQPAQETEQFTFVDTSDWIDVQPPDKSYAVRYIRFILNGYCDDIDSSLMLGMVYGAEHYPCGSLKDAVMQRYVSGGLLLLTHVAIGPAEDLWDRGGAKPITVTLSGGQMASRYSYANVVDGQTYFTIEYTTTYKTKDYTDVMHWGGNYGLDPKQSPQVFDAIIQKTWTFD